jgi:hypothetical protein
MRALGKNGRTKRFARNSYTPVCCSLRTIVLWLVTSVFVEGSGAHTLLGTVIQVFNPASVHLYTDKPADDLHWTNLRVVWEYPYSDQWEPNQYKQTDLCLSITGLEKCQGEGKREGEIIDFKKAPLLFIERLYKCGGGEFKIILMDHSIPLFTRPNVQLLFLHQFVPPFARGQVVLRNSSNSCTTS